MKKQLNIKWRPPVTKVQAACAAGGIVLYAVLELSTFWGRQDVFYGEGLKRAGPGQGDNIYEVLVKGLDKDQEDKKLLIEIIN